MPAPQKQLRPCFAAWFLSLLFFLVLPTWAGHPGAQQPAAEEQFRQATAAMQQGRLEEAARGFAAVVKLSPSFAEGHLNLGLALEELGRFGDAVLSFQKALALKPRLRGANLFLGVARYRLNRLDDAAKDVQRETTLNPADPGAWMWLGVIQMAAGRPEDASLALDKAAKLAPGNVDILYHRGRAHLLVSRNSYEAMFKADSGSWRVHQVLAQAYAEADRDKESVAEYEAAIKLVPGQPGLHEELGTELRKMNQLGPAAEALTRELEIDPTNTLARYKLGSLLVERGDAAQGKPLITEAIGQNPRLHDAHYYLGRAEMQLGNDEAAVAAFKRVLSGEADPEIVQQAYYQLALVYRRLHRTAEAQEALATFQRLKQEASEHQQQLFEKKREAQELEKKDTNQVQP